MPEFNNGWGAGVVHKESQVIADKIFAEALTKHENIVLPKVGSNYEKLLRNYIYKAKSEGYRTYVHFVDLKREIALCRMLNRFIETGRFLEPKLIEKYYNERDGNRIEQTYEKLKKGGMLDGYSKWNNEVERGRRPILIESNCGSNFTRRIESGGLSARDSRDMGGDRRGFRPGNVLYERTLGHSKKSVNPTDAKTDKYALRRHHSGRKRTDEPVETPKPDYQGIS